MKRLITFRHAKSGWDQPATRDFDRALNDKGKRAALTMGRHMRALGMSFDSVIASPAVRVVETLDAMFDGYGRRPAVGWDRRVYLASTATLLEIVQEAPDSAETILLAGHNPGIEELVLDLSTDAGEEEIRARGEVGEKYPTASVAELVFDVAHWADVEEGGGHLVRFVRPRDVDPALGPDRVN
ncbi:MAG TPA: histidine phosphatase family protein [Sphingomonas sp.]